MSLNRRQLLKLISGSVAASLLSRSVLAQAKPKIKAIAFDGFVIFDPRPIFGLTKKLFPEQGNALAQLWFTKIFGYTWLRTVGEHYKSFYAVIEDALIFSAESLKLDLPLEKQKPYFPFSNAARFFSNANGGKARWGRPKFETFAER